MVTQLKKIFCVLKFCSTRRVSTVYQGFQRNLHKIPSCASVMFLGTFDMQSWKMSGMRQSIILTFAEPQTE